MFSLKDLYKKISTNSKLKKWLVIGVFGIILMIFASTLKAPDSENSLLNNENVQKTTNLQQNGYENSYADGKEELQKELEELLSKIENAGRVKVLITYENNGVLQTEKNVRQKENKISEKDSDGGSREIIESETESDIIYEESGNLKNPFIISQINPKIRGVAVVAEGADDRVVVEKITRTLEVLLDIPVHKIQVMK